MKLHGTWPTLHQEHPSYKSYRTYKSYFSANSIGIALCAMHIEKAMHMVHGGKPHFSPHGPPFRPCIIWGPAARNAFLRLPRSALTASPRMLEIAQGYAVRSISSAQCAMPATGNMRCFFLNRIAHGAWGETLLFPPWAPFSPVCYMGACGTQCVLEVTALAPAPAATGRLKCSVTAWCRCHVVGCSFALEPPFFHTNRS